MVKNKIYVTNAEDRNTVAIVLIKNGYTVRIEKEKGKNTKVIHYVEYWRGDEYAGN